MSPEDELKSKAEALAARKIEHFLHLQQRDDEPQTLEARIEKGIRFTDVIYNRDFKRWELIGHGKENLLLSLLENPALVESTFTQHLPGKIKSQTAQLSTWINSQGYDVKSDPNHYRVYLRELRNLKKSYEHGSQISFAIPSMKYPPSDKNTVILTVAKPMSQGRVLVKF